MIKFEIDLKMCNSESRKYLTSAYNYPEFGHINRSVLTVCERYVFAEEQKVMVNLLLRKALITFTMKSPVYEFKVPNKYLLLFIILLSITYIYIHVFSIEMSLLVLTNEIFLSV